MEEKFSEFRVTEKSLKHELGVNLKILSVFMALWYHLSLSYTGCCGFLDSLFLQFFYKFYRFQEFI